MVLIKEMDEDQVQIKKEEKILKNITQKSEESKIIKKSRKFTLILDNKPPESENEPKQNLTEADKRLAAELDDEEKAKNYPR